MITLSPGPVDLEMPVEGFVDDLRQISAGLGVSLTTLVVAWTVRQSGITAALCGAKRAWQIRESAAGGVLRLSEDVLGAVERALLRRGRAQTRAAV